MGSKVTVVIPVGPYAVYKRWLHECLDSVRAQTYPADEMLVIDDMAGLEINRNWAGDDEFASLEGYPESRIWLPPWRLGDVGAFNCGVGLAQHELVFLLSCDDTLEPECLEMCVAEWEKHEQRDAVYYVGAHIIGCKGERVAPDQHAPFGNAMVTKGLWRITGGYTPGTGIGDWFFLQLLGNYFPDRCFPVAGAKALYNARSHDQSVTIRMQTNAPPIWPTEWGRIS